MLDGDLRYWFVGDRPDSIYGHFFQSESPMAQSIAPLLPQLAVFEFLIEEDYPIIEKFMFRYQYEEGKYVFMEGTHGGYMFFIVDGIAEVTKQIENQKTTIATLSAGRSLGEMSLIDGGTRSATVRAQTDLTLIVLKREDFNRLLEEHPETASRIVIGIASLLSRSLREMTTEFTEKILSLC